MAPNTTFELLNFNPFIAYDVNFFHDNVSPLDTDYISPDDFSGIFEISGVLINTLNLLQNSTNH